MTITINAAPKTQPITIPMITPVLRIECFCGDAVADWEEIGLAFANGFRIIKPSWIEATVSVLVVGILALTPPLKLEWARIG
jgi:hypothetical protein